MTSDYVECEEVAGKTIQTLRIYRDTGDGIEIQIDFPDGTSFTCCYSVKTAVDASVIRAGNGQPEILKSYALAQLS